METPDFEQIARGLLTVRSDPGDGTGDLLTDAFWAETRRAVAEQLRLIWNARGAADLVKLEAELSSLMGVTAAGPYVKNLDRALRTLDR